MSDHQTLYRHYDDDGRLLYIGITSKIPRRTHEHSRHSPWWLSIKSIKIEHFPDRKSALEAERDAISAEKPFYNTHHNRPKHLKSGKILAIRPDEIGPGDKITERIVHFRPLYDLAEAASICGLSLRVIRREIEQGRLGSISILNNTETKMKVYVSGWQIIDWLESIGAK